MFDDVLVKLSINRLYTLKSLKNDRNFVFDIGVFACRSDSIFVRSTSNSTGLIKLTRYSTVFVNKWQFLILKSVPVPRGRLKFRPHA